MITPEDFAELEAELEAMSHITREEWERQFSDLSAELERLSLSLAAEIDQTQNRPQAEASS